MKKAGIWLLSWFAILCSLSAQVLDEPAVSVAIDGQDNRYRVTDDSSASDPGTLFRQLAGEASWTAAEIGGTAIGEMRAVGAFGDTVVAVGADSGRIVRSGDAGETWADGGDADGSNVFGPFNGTWHSVATDGEGTWLAVGEVDGGLAAALSENDGQDWRRVDPVNPPFGNFADAVYDPDSGLWLAVGGDGFEGLAWTYDPSSSDWSEVDLSAETPSPLRAVAANHRGELLAVGLSGELIAFEDLGNDPPTIIRPDGPPSQDFLAVIALPDGSFLAGGVEAIQATYLPAPLSSSGMDEFTILLEAPGNGTIHDYELPPGETVPLVAATAFGGEPLLFLQGALDLGDRAENAPATSGTVSVANLGGGTLTVDSVAVEDPSPFTVDSVTVEGVSVSSPYSFDLPAGESAVITVGFSTGSTGTFTDSLTVETTASGTLSTALAATGVPNPTFDSSFPTAEEIVEGREFTYDITVTDPNYQDEIDISVSSGTLPEGLELTDNGSGEGTLSGVPAVGSADTYNFTLKASVDSTGGTAEQPITATVLTPPSIALSGNVDFGDILVETTASQTFTVSNNGGATLEVTSITSDDSVFPVSDSDGFSLAGNSSQEVTVFFQPTSAGPDVATITVASATAGNPTLEAKGYGAADALQLYLLEAGLTEGEITPDADPDTDSKENVLEFAFGSDPASASSLPRMVASTVSASGSSYPALSFQHRQTDPDPTESPFTVDGITYTVQGSTDLTEWNESVVVATDPGSLPNPETGYEWITFRLENIPLSTSGAKGFLRVEVSQ